MISYIEYQWYKINLSTEMFIESLYKEMKLSDLEDNKKLWEENDSLKQENYSYKTKYDKCKEKIVI